MKLQIKNGKLIIIIEPGDFIEPGVIYNGDIINLELKAPLNLMKNLKPVLQDKV